jgi:sulfopyruvate decarboxylase subunit alpha
MQSAVTERLMLALEQANTDWLVVVPTSGLNAIYSQFEQRDRCLYVTREEEGVAVAAGLAVGGKTPLVMMQQSGVGNSLNAVFSLADAYGILFSILICDRGPDDPNEVQRVSSKKTSKVLNALDCVVVDFRSSDSPKLFAEFVHSRVRWIHCFL